jgi:hypothetical protein
MIAQTTTKTNYLQIHKNREKGHKKENIRNESYKASAI